MKAEKGDITEAGQNPAFHHLHSRFYLCFIPGFPYSGGNDGTPVMGSHLLLAGVEVRLIVAGPFDPGFKVIRDHYHGNPTKKAKALLWEPIQSGRDWVHEASA